MFGNLFPCCFPLPSFLSIETLLLYKGTCVQYIILLQQSFVFVPFSENGFDISVRNTTKEYEGNETPLLLHLMTLFNNKICI